MENISFEKAFAKFGLTRQEAVIYMQLLSGGAKTGYEISKVTGISRSNVYSALSSLVEKGAAYLLEGTAKKYVPVSLDEFCSNRIETLENEKRWLLSNIQAQKRQCEGYITIEGERNILNKIKNLIADAEKRAYISCSAHMLDVLKHEIEAAALKKQIVIITDNERDFENAKVYVTESKENQIGVITDSKFVLTGECGKNSSNTCLYSGQKNFVLLFKTALSNEIKLIQYTKGV
ncbi:MAG: TrmB family transcriptional regulator [Firmicutes bacterium]|nr:TrmB family transcriptional regulator [Bacillota bacterium]